tara:strand:- start:3043 stop:3234 length:192 start_codon:yes stop_codon:yes gene_type:complete
MFTEAGLAAVEEAIAGGYLRVKYDDKEVWYRSLSELLQTRDLIRSKLGNGVKNRKLVSFKRDY